VRLNAQIPTRALTGTFDMQLVALSVLIAIMASYAALDLGGRVTATRGKLRVVWLLGGAFAMGLGIWSMHYIGMLAYDLPIPVDYDWPTVLLSLVAAILASVVALFVVSRKTLRLKPVVIGSLLMGSGIAAMHYVGMAAMRLSAMCRYSFLLVGLSVVLAIVISFVALWLTFHFRTADKAAGWRKLGSALLMGAAIPTMHYTGMAAVSFWPSNQPLDLTNTVEISSIGIVGIGSVTFMVLSLAIGTSYIDRLFSRQAMELHLSEQRLRQLVESVQVILWRGSLDNAGFSYINQEAEDLLGYPVRQWIETPSFWLDHLHPDDREMAQEHCRAAVENHVPELFEHRMTTADGRTLWLRSSVSLVSGEDEARELVGVMTDITVRKQAQEAAEEASRTKSGLLAEISSLHEKLRQENIRMSSELEVTQRLQQMMLPREEDLRKIGGLDIAGSMQPAAEVGGDYYDVVSKNGGVFFGIGDVTGHGLESGVIAIMVQTAVRTLLANGQYKSGEFFPVLNQVIYDNVRRMGCDRSLTMSLLHYQDKTITVSGQHEELLVIRGNGAVERHDTLNLGFALGLEENINEFIGEATLPLTSNDVLVAYTDGITEAMNPGGVTFGVERLAEAIKANHEQPAESIRSAVLRSVREYTGGADLLDDISLLVIKPT
jgi:PAS domain S-box-containing protein